MRKTFNHRIGKNEYSLITIITKIHKPRKLKKRVGIVMEENNGLGYYHEKVKPGWKAVDTLSTEAFISGDLIIDSEMEHIYSTFKTNFYFTCAKNNCDSYKLLWVSSLS